MDLTEPGSDTAAGMIARATEALREAGLLARSRVLAAERLTSGKASAVYKVALANGRAVVFKSAAACVIETEALWLRAWREVGVDTPEVYGTGALADGTAYVLMELLNGPSVEAELMTGGLPYDATMRTLGRTLATMHTVRGLGYGSSTWDHVDADGNGRFATLREHLFSENLPRGLAFAAEIGAITDADRDAVERAVDILDADASSIGPRRTHGDFRVGNMIRIGDRLFVLDPNSASTHPCLCLAYSLLLPTLFDNERMDTFMAGYTEVSPIDPRVQDAALLVRAGIMFDSFGRRRQFAHGLRMQSTFARQRERFTVGG